MAWAHPGAVLALFHLYESRVDQGLLDVCLQIGPSAQLSVGHLDWNVAVVPAALRLSLAQRVRGLSGLILAEDDLHQVDAECCGRLLRNVVTGLGYAELAEFVTVPCADADESERRAQVDVRLPDALQGFAGESRTPHQHLVHQPHDHDDDHASPDQQLTTKAREDGDKPSSTDATGYSAPTAGVLDSSRMTSPVGHAKGGGTRQVNDQVVLTALVLH